jgi:hypothetical protein
VKYRSINCLKSQVGDVPRTFLRFESSQTVRNAYLTHYPFSLLITAELDVQVASNLPPGLLTSARRWICMGVLSTRKAVTWMNSSAILTGRMNVVLTWVVMLGGNSR